MARSFRFTNFLPVAELSGAADEEEEKEEKHLLRFVRIEERSCPHPLGACKS